MFCSRQHIMTHSCQALLLQANHQWKLQRTKGPIRSPEALPMEQHTMFYDNSLLSVGEIILILIQSVPEIPKLHIFCSRILCATLSKALAKSRKTTSACLPSSKAFDHWWCDRTIWVKSYYNLYIYLAFHHVCQDQYIYKVYQTKVILVLM